MTVLDAYEPAIDAGRRAEIEAKLDAVERDEHVRILFAVESGSRAWGFPSPDSDYDARFVYAHPADWYVSLTPGRDVIELPIAGDLDINGWDIRKALNLLMKPNPVLLEWLASPIRYRWDADATDAILALAAKVPHATACLHHYFNLGEEQWRRHIGDRERVNGKKYFYVLRPALALRWLRLNPETLPPMNLQALVAGLDLDAATVADIARLMEQKARARETGESDRIAAIDRLIEEELAWARTADIRAAPLKLRGEADTLFRRIVKEVA